MFTRGELEKEMPGLLRFARRLAGNSHDADDLYQSTLLKAMEKKHQFTAGTSLFSWCSRIMFNLFASQRRRATKFETQYDPQPIIESQTEPDDKYLYIRLAEVSQGIRKLAKPHRQVLRTVCVNGTRYSDLAERLDVPVGTIRSRLHRARAELRRIV